MGNLSMFSDSPLFAFLLLMAFAVIPTYILYQVIGKVIEANPATFEGSLSGFAVKFGGPVAFYAFLIVFGSIYFIHPTTPTIHFKGHVTSADDGSNLPKYYIGVISGGLKPVQASEFDILVPKGEDYAFVVMNDSKTFALVRPLSKEELNNPTSIHITNFPNLQETKIKQTGEVDIHYPLEGESPKGPYQVEIKPMIWPPSHILSEGEQLEFTVENTYRAVYKDGEGNYFYEQQLPPVVPGQVIHWKPRIEIK